MARIEFVLEEESKKEICNTILRSLPGWFGIEEAIVEYTNGVESMLFWAYKDQDNYIGFVALKVHSKETVEIYVMGILESYHRKGIGRRLLYACESYLQENKFKYFAVKTLSPKRESKEYEVTRKFYERYGFYHMEEFSELWGKDNPCLMLIKNVELNIKSSWTPPMIKTERLLLRPLMENDAEDIFSYAQKSIVSKYTLWEPHKTPDDSKGFILDYAFSNYQNGVPEPWAITEKKSGKMIGTVGCFWVSKKNKTMELAYALSDEYWGRGIIVEVSRKVVDYCFKLYGLKRLQCRCKEENRASYRVMEKLGMAKEGTLRDSVYHQDKFWNMKYYSFVETEWMELIKSSSSAFVRRARFGDERGIHDAHMRSIRELCSTDYKEEQVDVWGGREYNFEVRNLDIKNDFGWAIEKNDRIEGYGHLKMDVPKNHAEVWALYLTPEVAGQDLGKEILFYMKEIVRINGFSELYVSSTITAKSFYESQGLK